MLAIFISIWTPSRALGFMSSRLNLLPGEIVSKSAFGDWPLALGYHAE
jgi:hypothetical protein